MEAPGPLRERGARGVRRGCVAAFPFDAPAPHAPPLGFLLHCSPLTASHGLRDEQPLDAKHDEIARQVEPAPDAQEPRDVQGAVRMTHLPTEPSANNDRAAVAATTRMWMRCDTHGVRPRCCVADARRRTDDATPDPLSRGRRGRRARLAAPPPSSPPSAEKERTPSSERRALRLPPLPALAARASRPPSRRGDEAPASPSPSIPPADRPRRTIELTCRMRNGTSFQTSCVRLMFM